MSKTIPEVSQDANDLYTTLTDGLDISIDVPEITLGTSFEIPSEVGNPAYSTVPQLTIDELTTKEIGGTGVFDSMMAAVNTHMAEQFNKGRLTGADYAKVYLAAIQGAMQQGVQFLLGRDRTYYENLLVQAQLRTAQNQAIESAANVEIARGKIQQMALGMVTIKLDTYTSRNKYALSKMDLVNGYENVLANEAQVKLVLEQYDTQRAQTKDTLEDGTAIAGIVAQDKELKEAQALTAKENLDVARAQTKDTLLDGGSVKGLVAIDKAFKEAQQVQMEHQGALTLEQVEAARAQTRDTLTTGQPISGLAAIEKLIKTAQAELINEQVETARAQTWDTHTDATPILGIAKFEKALKEAQATLVSEQYEAQRGQTRGTLSTGETVVGLIGAQTKLYEQQVTSYKRDGETKGLKMVMDSWIARKTIDEGVAVPAAIDTPAIETYMATFMGNLSL